MKSGSIMERLTLGRTRDAPANSAEGTLECNLSEDRVLSPGLVKVSEAYTRTVPYRTVRTITLLLYKMCVCVFESVPLQTQLYAGRFVRGRSGGRV